MKTAKNSRHNAKRQPRDVRTGVSTHAALDSMVEFLEEQLGSLPELEIKRMFGGHGLLAAGRMFGILYQGRLFFKVSPQTAKWYISQGSEPFRPSPGRVLKTYYAVPAEAVESEVELLTLARVASQLPTAAERKAKTRCTPEQIFAPFGKRVQVLGRRLRELVMRVVPEAEEAGYPGWKLVGYRAPHYFCFLAPQVDHVRLGFEHGIELDDPAGILEGEGRQVRYVRITVPQDIQEETLSSLIRAARALRVR